jgi:hypothetical protein
MSQPTEMMGGIIPAIKGNQNSGKMNAELRFVGHQMNGFPQKFSRLAQITETLLDLPQRRPNGRVFGQLLGEPTQMGQRFGKFPKLQQSLCQKFSGFKVFRLLFDEGFKGFPNPLPFTLLRQPLRSF